jgi:catechol 2,3-dioxygenase-like lactoylglutathione lyase family enzyme
MAILEMRVAVTVEDWERAVAFYRDAIGLDEGSIWTDHGKGQIFMSGRATLEIFDEAHAAAVDQIEVGQRVSGQFRFAFEVEDVRAAVARAVQHGVTLVHEPTLTPWNDLNARIQSPDGLQITLFQVMK